MLAAVLKDFNQLELEDVPTPEPGTGEAVVAIKSCGFCATDYKAITGVRRNVSFPMIPGHEPSGVVSAVGRDVTHIQEGDAVVVQPSGYCGVCRPCTTGNTHFCENSFTTGGDGLDDVRDGAFAEFMKTTAACCIAKPENISHDAGCLTEPLSGAWKGLIQYSEMSIGDDVVIIGTGGIGLLCLMVARAAGAGRLIAIDTSDYALANAKRLGATHTVNPARGDVKQAVYTIIPNGPDLVVEAAGPIQAVELARDLRRRGTRWNIFGITTHETFQLDGGLTHFMEGRMDASFSTTPLAMLKALKLIETGLVDPEQIISHRFPLSEIHQAVEVMATAERNKVLINP